MAFNAGRLCGAWLVVGGADMSAVLSRAAIPPLCEACQEREPDVVIASQAICALCAHAVMGICTECGRVYEDCRCEVAA